VGKGKRADIYLEVRKRRGIYFLEETSACARMPEKISKLAQKYFLSFHSGTRKEFHFFSST
jgi:hypothetical protein